MPDDHTEYASSKKKPVMEKKDCGETCIAIVRQAEKLKGIERMMKWLMAFFIGSFLLQGTTFIYLIDYKTDHAVVEAEEQRRFDSVMHVATDAKNAIATHISEKNPEKGRAIHAELSQRITTLEYKTGVK